MIYCLCIGGEVFGNAGGLKRARRKVYVSLRKQGAGQERGGGIRGIRSVL